MPDDPEAYRAEFTIRDAESSGSAKAVADVL